MNTPHPTALGVAAYLSSAAAEGLISRSVVEALASELSDSLPGIWMDAEESGEARRRARALYLQRLSDSLEDRVAELPKRKPTSR